MKKARTEEERITTRIQIQLLPVQSSFPYYPYAVGKASWPSEGKSQGPRVLVSGHRVGWKATKELGESGEE